MSANPGFTWLANRGISEETANEFGLCYCDRSIQITPMLPESFLPFLEVYFSNSVLIPLNTIYGKPYSLCARLLNHNAAAKNLYHKGFKKTNVLYGLDKSYPYILKHKRCFVVEGPFDFYMMWQSGIRNVICLLGTQMSWYQIGILSRYTRNCVLALDPDRAGQEAAKKLKDNLQKYGITSTSFDLKGVDPDDYIRKHGSEEFTRINESINIQTPAGLTV